LPVKRIAGLETTIDPKRPIGFKAIRVFFYEKI
jgi:hypothetical protein